MIEATYTPIKTVIKDIIEETPTIKTFVLSPEVPVKFKTGQFVQLTYPGIGEAPFTPSSDPDNLETIELTIMNVGKITSLLHNTNSGQVVGLRGPYGNGYPYEKFTEKEILIVGGGVGLAPLRSLIFTLLARKDNYKKIIIRYGARTPKDLVFKKELGIWRRDEKVDIKLTVDKKDDTWRENEGVVTTILDKNDIDLENAVAIVCGPPIMMKFATFKLQDIGFKPKDIYLSMEKNMSCGIGKCGHCRLGYFYVCKDGPVFTYDKIKDIPDLWD